MRKYDLFDDVVAPMLDGGLIGWLSAWIAGADPVTREQFAIGGALLGVAVWAIQIYLHRLVKNRDADRE